jgi:hypothetical protein
MKELKKKRIYNSVFLQHEVSQESVASIFRVEEIPGASSNRLTLLLPRDISSTLKMEATGSTETLVYNKRC